MSSIDGVNPGVFRWQHLKTRSAIGILGEAWAATPEKGQRTARRDLAGRRGCARRRALVERSDLRMPRMDLLAIEALSSMEASRRIRIGRHRAQ
jgi:hypothetical protein